MTPIGKANDTDRIRVGFLSACARKTKPLRVPSRHRTPITSGYYILDYVERLVRSNAFDIASIVLVILNTINVAAEAQYNSSAVAVDLGYNGQHTPLVDPRFDGGDVFQLLGMVCGIMFCVEISLRVVGLRARFFKSAWNILDLAVVILWLFSLHRRKTPYVIFLARLHKFTRLLRLFKLVRKMQGFDALFLMTTSLRSSASILFWTICLLSVVVLFTALALQQFLVEFYFRDTAIAASDRRRLFRYFGSVTTSMFGVFELMLGNFAPLSRELYERVGEPFIFITIVFKVMIGFAVLGIINGVLIQETFKVAQTNDELIVRRGRSMSRVHQQKVRQLMTTVARSDDKSLDRRQFREMFEHPDLSRWLASMELAPADVDGLFEMMDNGAGLLTVDDVVQGFAKFKGSARTCDLHLLWRDQRELLREHRHLREAIERQLAPHSAAPGQRGTGPCQEESVLPRMEEGVPI